MSVSYTHLDVYKRQQYPYIKITVKEPFPRIFLTRRLERDGSKYFGPYMSAGNTKETLELIKKIFKIRTCNKVLPRDIGKDRPCLYYHIGQCSAPCDGKISQEEYSELFNKISAVLGGDYSLIENILTEKMCIRDSSSQGEHDANSGRRAASDISTNEVIIQGER